MLSKLYHILPTVSIGKLKNFLQPLLAFEKQYEQHKDDDAHDNHGQIALLPVELAHARKIHAVPARDQRQRQ